ncbi:MAG: TIGR01212 family radical SAM protein [Bacteroidales bacterium]|nr:TIGR01212 family radical SAM protein [Bacteroidales bacterium]
MYREYATYIKEKFGSRVQKIALNPGFGCPNRDGKIGVGGCTYCNNKTFSPFYGQASKPIEQQMDEGIAFFAKKYKCQKYIAYFQSYTNTYANIDKLKEIYNSALKRDDVIGLTVATRPDCADDQVLDLLVDFSKKYYTVLEIGVESCYNPTLQMINRHHTFQQAEDTIKRAAAKGLEVCVHLIMYLPGETYEMMMNTADIIKSLPVNILKLHQLQIIKGTEMEKQYFSQPELFHLPTVEEYSKFCAEYAKRIGNEIIFERFVSESPKDMLVAPLWNGLKNYEITEKIKKEYLKITK